MRKKIIAAAALITIATLNPSCKHVRQTPNQVYVKYLFHHIKKQRG